MGKEIKVRIIMRWNTTEGWATLSGSDILAKGEIGLEYISGSVLPKMKIGNGDLSWDNLPYFETSLPKNFTWGNLRGTTLQTETEKTSNLNLTKPGFLDVVNIVTLNKNFEKIDSEYKLHSEEMNNLGARITALSQLTEIPENTLSSEIVDARIRFSGDQKDSLGDTLRAIDKDLQEYKIFVDSILTNLKMPSSLEINEEGKLYLIDKEGNKIGEEVVVKDFALENKVGSLDSKVQLLDTRVKDNMLNIGDLNQKISKLPSTFPNNLIYEDNKLYLAVDDEVIEDSMVEITGGGGGGSETTYKIELTASERELSKPLGEKVSITFTYRSYDKEDNSITDGPGSAVLLVSDVQRANFSVQQGENTIDVTEYLVAGDNVLKIKVTNSEGSSKTLRFNIKLLALSISSNFPVLSHQKQGNLPISYTVMSEGEFTSHFVIQKQNAVPGEAYYEETEIFSETFSRGTTATASIAVLPSGSYTLKIFATSGEVTSNILKIGLIIYTNSDIYPFISMVPNRTEFTQGEIITIPYIIYYPNNPTFDIKFYVLKEDNSVFSEETITGITSIPQELSIQKYPMGKIKLKIEVVNTEISNSVEIQVNESEISLDLFTDGLVFEFDPIGRTNQNSANEWSYTDSNKKTYTASFTGVDWGTLDGWQVKPGEDQTMLRILPGGQMTIPFYPFEEEITNNNVGYTIEVEVATQNVTNYDSLILSSFDDSDGVNRGLRIYSQSAELKSQNNTISAQFKEDERIRLTFTIEPATLNKLIMIYINGVLCGIKKYEQDAFRHTKQFPITIGANDSGIDVYFIRAYKRVLNESQQLNNFCVDRPSYGEKVSAVTRNDILNASAGGDFSRMITINSLKGTIPYIIMHCPKLPANKDQDKFKGMKMTFVDPANPSRSFTAENCTFSVQGTSSAGYPVKNFKIKLDKETGIKYTRNGQIDLDGFYFEGKGKSQPTKVFCLKADYASSENANNVMLVDFYNEVSPYRNEAQKYQTDNGMPETVRHGVHGEPIVLFWQNTNSGEIYFQGKYNFNDDKDAEEVFGYKGVLPKDKYNIECWEFTNNNMPLCLFQHNLSEGDNAWFGETDGVAAWANSFERRFPEQEDDVVPDLTAFRRMVDWVASTNQGQANNEKELATPFYYKTLDKTYDPNKKEKYYSQNADGSFSLVSIVEKDSISSNVTGVIIDQSLIGGFITKVQTETRPIDISFLKNNDGTWKVFYKEEEQEYVIFSNLPVSDPNSTETFGKYGILLQDTTLESFSIKLYVGNNWTSQLYEYHTHDTAAYRLAKFKNEFEDYFILDAMAFYYVFTETVLLMDNRAKNMFLVSYDVDIKPVKVGDEIIYEKQPAGTYGHWAPTPYDMDSALGINNEGELVYGYHLEDTGEDGKVFTGQDSVLWNNFRDCFQTEISEMYLQIRGQTTRKSFSYENLSTKMNNHQNAWPEIVWNIDQQIKYLQPFYKGTDHLAMAQGDKRAQRNFWLYNAFKYRDSKYSAGDALDNFILFRLNGPGEFNIVPYSNIYARVRFGNAKDSKQRAFRNETVTFSTEGITSIYDLETYVYSADRISSIGDLSDFNIGLCNFANATKLKEIILGSERPNYENNHLKNFRVGASSVLKEVNLSNCKALEMEINLEECPILETFKAKGSKISGVIFAKGARLSTCYLPVTVSTLSLRDLKYLDEEGLQIETKANGKYGFSGIRLENCPQLPFYDLIMNSDNLRALRLVGLDWHTTLNSGTENFMAFYNKVKNLINLKDDGSEDPENLPYISGRVYLEEQISIELLEEINGYFPNLIIVVNNKPQYFLTFKDYKNELICKYIAEEGSVAIDPTITQPPGVDKTPAQVLAILNEKPSEDNVKNNEDPEGEIDTDYVFSRWSNLPQRVTSNAVITPVYQEIYLIKFFNENKTEKLFEDQWVSKGSAANDPLMGTIPTKEPTAEFSYTYAGWSESLSNISKPTNFSLIFSEKVNTYLVKFFSGEKELVEHEQRVEYGKSPVIPPTEIVHKYFKNPEGDNYLYYEIYEHIGWDIYNDGNIETNNVNSNEGLIIRPINYTTEPIQIYAVFSSIEPTTDSWETILAACEDDSYKTKYPIGTQKRIKFRYNNKIYEGIVEIVGHDHDTLAVETNKSTASISFILKDIFLVTAFRSGDTQWTSFLQDELTGEFITITGPLAGGWTNNAIYENLSAIQFMDVELNDHADYLNNNIKSVIKKTDFGPRYDYNTNINEYHPILNLLERIWTPSALEMGVLEPANKDAAAQQGKTYIWFTTNDSRIKNFNGEGTVYWTRTWTKSPYRFYGVGPDGGYAFSGSPPDFGVRSYDSAGLIFGFCI